MSRVSLQKKQRIVYLMRTRSEFAMLLSSIWEDTSKRESISRAAILLDQFEMDETLIDHLLPEYEAAWAVLQLVSMDRTYLAKTAYNMFTLIRQGNSYVSVNDQVRLRDDAIVVLSADLTPGYLGYLFSSKEITTSICRAISAREALRPDSNREDDWPNTFRYDTLPPQHACHGRSQR